jgi:hypothetical protein
MKEYTQFIINISNLNLFPWSREYYLEKVTKEYKEI